MEHALTILAPHIINHLHSLPDLAEFSLVSRAVHQAIGERTLLNAAWHCLTRQEQTWRLPKPNWSGGYQYRCPLSWAAAFGAVPLCNYIIATKETQSEVVAGALILACVGNQPAVIEAMSTACTIPHDFLMAVETAARLGNTECTLSLIRNNAGPPCAGYAMRMAAQLGRSKTVAAILSEHEVHQEDKNIALHQAIDWNASVDTARVLLENGAFPYQAILRATASDGPVDMLRLLLRHGCDARRFWLDSIGNPDTFSVLLDHLREKGDWDTATDGCRAFEEAVTAACAALYVRILSDFDKVLRLLLADGVDVNRREGWALTQAVIHGSLPVATLLLKWGADARAVSHEALQLAHDSGRCAVVKLVKGAAASRVNYQFDPLATDS